MGLKFSHVDFIHIKSIGQSFFYSFNTGNLFVFYHFMWWQTDNRSEEMTLIQNGKNPWHQLEIISKPYFNHDMTRYLLFSPSQLICRRITVPLFSPIHRGILFQDKREKSKRGEKISARDLCMFHRSLNQMVIFSLVHRFSLIENLIRLLVFSIVEFSLELSIGILA